MSDIDTIAAMSKCITDLRSCGVVASTDRVAKLVRDFSDHENKELRERAEAAECSLAEMAKLTSESTVSDQWLREFFEELRTEPFCLEERSAIKELLDVRAALKEVVGK